MDEYKFVNQSAPPACIKAFSLPPASLDQIQFQPPTLPQNWGDKGAEGKQKLAAQMTTWITTILIIITQKIQDNCIRYIKHNQTKHDLENPLQILSVDSMIALANYRFGYKLMHKLLPKKTSEICLYDSRNKTLLPKHHYQTRNRNVPNLPSNCSNQYKNSFLCKGPRSLLTLNVEIRNRPSLQSFSRACKKLLLSKA